MNLLISKLTNCKLTKDVLPIGTLKFTNQNWGLMTKNLQIFNSDFFLKNLDIFFSWVGVKPKYKPFTIKSPSNFKPSNSSSPFDYLFFGPSLFPDRLIVCRSVSLNLNKMFYKAQFMDA